MTLPRSDDPLPPNAIRFSEAFELFYRSIEGWQEIEARVADAIAKYNEDPSELMELPRFLGQGAITERHRLAVARSEAIAAQETARADAWESWRSDLAGGRFEPCIRDPRTGDILHLDKRGWACDPGLGPGPEIEDFVCHDDPRQPGPSTEIDGKLRPVFFNRDTFAAALSSQTKAAAPENPKAAKAGRGPKPKYDPQYIYEIVFYLMDENGEISPDDPDWKTQGDLERAVADRLAKDGLYPSESRLRELVTPALEAWRSKKADN
jgi:hypothetical protein